MRAFFEPAAVAVLGASRTPGKAGHQQVANLRRAYRGRVYPVNPAAPEICGLPCFPDLDAVPGPVDLAIVLLPAGRVPDAVGACVRRAVPAVLVPSAGFGEAGEEGRRAQAALDAETAGSATRVWGPNSNGLVNTANGLLASFVDLPRVRPGPIAVVSETGIFAAGYLNQLMELPGFGVSKVATLGNAADVDECDVLEYLADDPDTRVVAVHLEGFKDGRRFADLCARAARVKPVVVLLAGQTEAGARASLAHTANLAGRAEVARAALRQAGAVLVEDFREMIEAGRALATWDAVRPAQRVAVLTTSGGAGVLAVDHLVGAGLAPAVLAPETQARLAAIGPAPAPCNPLDVWPAMERHGADATVPAIVDAVLADPEVDAALVILGAFSGGGDAFDPATLAGVLARHDKPCAAWLYGPSASTGPWADALRAMRVPSLDDLRGAARALAGGDALARWRHEPAPRVVAPGPVAAAAAFVEAARACPGRMLDEVESRRLLALWGIPSPRERLVENEDEAVEAAAEIGFPVVLKLVSRDLAHKTDAGAVTLDVRDARAAREAARRMCAAAAAAAPRARIEGILVQEQIAGGREVVVGVTTSPQFGPVVMFGQGGVLVEALADVAFRLPPLDRAGAAALVRSSRAAIALGAHRGRPAADVDALCDAIASLSRLVEAGLGVEQVEINPLVVRDVGRGVVAVDGLVVLGGRR